MEPPKSMDECLYFTNRQDGNQKIIAWVCKQPCPRCNKAKMGKPVEKGSVKIRAKEYKCPDCGHCEGKEEHENNCTVNINYTCDCGHSGETNTPYIRKTFEGVPSYVFVCEGCSKKIGITKKMKKSKKK